MSAGLLFRRANSTCLTNILAILCGSSSTSSDVATSPVSRQCATWTPSAFSMNTLNVKCLIVFVFIAHLHYGYLDAEKLSKVSPRQRLLLHGLPCQVHFRMHPLSH